MQTVVTEKSYTRNLPNFWNFRVRISGQSLKKCIQELHESQYPEEAVKELLSLG